MDICVFTKGWDWPFPPRLTGHGHQLLLFSFSVHPLGLVPTRGRVHPTERVCSPYVPGLVSSLSQGLPLSRSHLLEALPLLQFPLRRVTELSFQSFIQICQSPVQNLQKLPVTKRRDLDIYLVIYNLKNTFK